MRVQLDNGVPRGVASQHLRRSAVEQTDRIGKIHRIEGEARREKLRQDNPFRALTDRFLDQLL